MQGCPANDFGFLSAKLFTLPLRRGFWALEGLNQHNFLHLSLTQLSSRHKRLHFASSWHRAVSSNKPKTFPSQQFYSLCRAQADNFLHFALNTTREDSVTACGVLTILFTLSRKQNKSVHFECTTTLNTYLDRRKEPNHTRFHKFIHFAYYAEQLCSP